MKEIITREQLIKKYIEFFKSKKHVEIKNSSLVPENDPTVLFTTAGMHPLVPFLLGEKHPLGKRLVNAQRCIRTGDIDEVGDDVHLTFFEMLGNWSLGDYFKKEAISYSYEFLTKELIIPIDKLTVSVFEGDKDAQRDEESVKIWQEQGISKDRIVYLPKKDNWWGPAGEVGPCGPDTEMFYWVKKTKPESFTEGENKKSWVEIWNNVFMQYNKTKDGKFIPLSQKNVDTGMGVERTLAILNGLDNVYDTNLFKPILKEIGSISEKKYEKNKREMRIIADHIKASVFIIADGVVPSNTERGYVLRRLIRRAVRFGNILGMRDFTPKVAQTIFKIYEDYDILKENKDKILAELEKEEKKFNETIEKGMREFEKLSKENKKLSGSDAFLLYQSYGFPIEITAELCKEQKIELDKEGFEKENKKHQELSKTASSGQFKSGLADNSQATTKLHTATHLLNQALREVLGKQDIFQKGSNITPERLRFDFNFDRKLTEEELKKVEDLVNEKIREKIDVEKSLMTTEAAKKSGAQGVFDSKYGSEVSVFSIGEFSKEICAGPHVKNTKELGKFKIQKEESSASGIRRIKAILE